MKSRIALGTVQLGLPYGVANQLGQVSREEAASILSYASSSGLDTLDTAIAYGESEQRLGEIGVTQWRVISKLPPAPGVGTDIERWVQESVRSSLQRLRMPRLYGLLLHRSQDLQEAGGDTLWRSLAALKHEGRVEKIGVSIYDPAELDALGSHIQLDLVQAPFNILDRRLASSGWLERLHRSGTEVHARSVFLQGLLLMHAEQRSARFSRWQPLWTRWERWLDEQGVTALRACVAFALSQRELARVVVGVDSVSQLREILAVDTARVIVPPLDLSCEDLDLINPSRWSVS